MTGRARSNVHNNFRFHTNNKNQNIQSNRILNSAYFTHRLQLIVQATCYRRQKETRQISLTDWNVKRCNQWSPSSDDTRFSVSQQAITFHYLGAKWINRLTQLSSMTFRMCLGLAESIHWHLMYCFVLPQATVVSFPRMCRASHDLNEANNVTFNHVDLSHALMLALTCNYN